MKIITSFLLIMFLLSCTSKKEIKNLNFLKGKWKVENQELYEEWNIVNIDSIQGESYKIKDEIKNVIEILSINYIENKIVYQAKVFNQNNGKTIQFTLNSKKKNKFSFENLKHDFPKKIQYTQLSQTEIFVEVLGDENKGFSYKMFKQNN